MDFFTFGGKDPWLRLANYQAYYISFLQKEKGKSFSEGKKLILFSILLEKEKANHFLRRTS